MNKGAFKMPALRDVELTVPYMHNGAYHMREEVVEHYNKGGISQENLDPNIKPLSLTGQDAGGYCRLLEEPDWQANGNKISATPYVLINNFLIN